MSRGRVTCGPPVPVPKECEKDDPWKHRSVLMRCPTCMYHCAKGSLGRCRRHAPTMSGYPVVTDGDWCGDHKLDETKTAGRP